MLRGQEFRIEGDTQAAVYAFMGYKNTKIRMRKVGTDKTYLMHPMNESKIVKLESINQDVVKEMEEENNRERNIFMTVSKMQENQYFIGQDNKKHIFTKMNRTRFLFRDDRGEFTNVFAFIKEPLDEFAPRKIEEFNIKTFKEGQVFIGLNDKKYVFFRMKKVKAEGVAYENHNMMYTFKNGFVKEVVDEIVEFAKCKYCGMPNENTKEDADNLCDNCISVFGIHTKYSEL